MPMSSDRRRVTVGLRPSTLNALYTPTSPPREDVVLRPGLFTEVDFGVAVLGIISGRIIRGSGPDAKGIPGAQVEAIDAAGRSVAASITARDGSYVLDELRPGSYVVRVTPNTLPADLELNRQEVTVEVRSGIEPFEATADFGVRQRDEAPR
jgi:hypothetical protein